ncbi:TIGR02444 family protein [Tsuneonella sp. HG094]
MPRSEGEADEFWEYSLRVYARTGVAEACLSLQDRHGCEVNLVLLCLWLAQNRKLWLRKEDLCAAQRSAAAPVEGVVRPLRMTRRWLKRWSRNALSDEPYASAYAALKQAELQGERLVQARLIADLRLDALGSAHSAAGAAQISFENYAAMSSAPETIARELEKLMGIALRCL